MFKFQTDIILATNVVAPYMIKVRCVIKFLASRPLSQKWEGKCFYLHNNNFRNAVLPIHACHDSEVAFFGVLPRINRQTPHK